MIFESESYGCSDKMIFTSIVSGQILGLGQFRVGLCVLMHTEGRTLLSKSLSQ